MIFTDTITRPAFLPRPFEPDAPENGPVLTVTLNCDQCRRSSASAESQQGAIAAALLAGWCFQQKVHYDYLHIDNIDTGQGHALCPRCFDEFSNG
jgi:hypothetical protein